MALVVWNVPAAIVRADNLFPEQVKKMMKSRTRFRAIVPALAIGSMLGIGQQTSAVVISPTLLTSSNLNSFNPPVNLTNNAGLSAAVNTGASLGTALAATHVFDGGFAQSWVTNGSGSDYFALQPAPVFVWDLGRDVKLSDLILWQYQNTGGGTTSAGNALRDFELRFASAASGPTFGGAADYANIAQSVAQVGGTNIAQQFDLTSLNATARYVELTVLDNQKNFNGVTGGGDRVGLGELRFNVDTTAHTITSFDLGGGELYTGAGPAAPDSPTTWVRVDASTANIGTDPLTGISLSVFNGTGYVNSNPAGSTVADLFNDFVYDGTGGSAGIQTANWTLTGLDDDLFYDLYFIAPNGEQFGAANVYGGSYEALGQVALASGAVNSFTQWIDGVNYAVLTGLRSTNGVINGFYNENPNDLSPANFGMAGLQVVAYAIPEPASLGLLTFAGIALLRRRARLA